MDSSPCVPVPVKPVLVAEWIAFDALGSDTQTHVVCVYTYAYTVFSSRRKEA